MLPLSVVYGSVRIMRQPGSGWLIFHHTSYPPPVLDAASGRLNVGSAVAADQGVTLIPIASLQDEQPFSVPEPTAHGMTWASARTAGTKESKVAAEKAGEKTLPNISKTMDERAISRVGKRLMKV